MAEPLRVPVSAKSCYGTCRPAPGKIRPERRRRGRSYRTGRCRSTCCGSGEAALSHERNVRYAKLVGSEPIEPLHLTRPPPRPSRSSDLSGSGGSAGDSVSCAIRYARVLLNDPRSETEPRGTPCNVNVATHSRRRQASRETGVRQAISSATIYLQQLNCITSKCPLRK